MLIIDIPDAKRIEAQDLVLDYNGTLAVDGLLLNGMRQLLEQLSAKLSIHILTADTYGTAKEQLQGISCSLEILEQPMQDLQKEMYLLKLGREHTIAIGNGVNDALMLKNAALSVVVIQKEGCSGRCLLNADIVCSSIFDALELLVTPQRIEATLRK